MATRKPATKKGTTKDPIVIKVKTPTEKNVVVPEEVITKEAVVIPEEVVLEKPAKEALEETPEEAPEEALEVPLYPTNGSGRVIDKLKQNCDYEFLYIGKQGRLFAEKSFRKSYDESAVLYKNPYFKK